MKFYLASTLSNASRARFVAEALERAGHVCTYPWWTHGAVSGKQRLTEVACAELAGVLDADAVIVLLPGGRGTHAEFGMALAAAKPVIVYDEGGAAFEPGPTTCSFYHLPQVMPMVGTLDRDLNLDALVLAVGSLARHPRTGYGHGAELLAAVTRHEMGGAA